MFTFGEDNLEGVETKKKYDEKESDDGGCDTGGSESEDLQTLLQPDTGPSELMTKFKIVEIPGTDIDQGARYVSVGLNHQVAVHENSVKVAFCSDEDNYIIEQPLAYTWGKSNDFGQMGLEESEVDKFEEEKDFEEVKQV